MNPTIAIAAGLTSGVGLTLIAIGLHGIEPTSAGPEPKVKPPRGPSLDGEMRLRVGLGFVGAVVMWVLAAWPVAIFLAALGGYVTPTLWGAKKRRDEAIAKTEAIATWAEQLRDTIGSAAGLQEAIAVTARVAPRQIRPAVQQLAAGMRHNPLSPMLREFAIEVDDPAADQIVIALILASERRGQNLTGLLGDVAEAARLEASMRMRTETSRSQTYSDAKAVTSIVLTVFFLLLLVNRPYLAAFDSLAGQCVMALVGAMWAFAIYGIAELSHVRRPPRILAINTQEGSTP